MPNRLKKYDKLRGKVGNKVPCQVDIGECNVNSWNRLKTKLNFKKDSDFVECLLSIAEKYLRSKLIISFDGRRIDDDDSNSSNCFAATGKTETSDDETVSPTAKKPLKNEPLTKTEVDKLSADDYETLEDKVKNVAAAKSNKDCDIKRGGKRQVKNCDDAAKRRKIASEDSALPTSAKPSKKEESDKNEEQLEKYVAAACYFCDSNHSKEDCPLYRPLDQFKIARDSVVDGLENEDRATYTLPNILEMKHKSEAGVFAKEPIEEYTVFGPLIGESIKEMEIADDSSMKDIWEVCEGNYLNTSDPTKSNWIRWLRPASSRHERNIVPVERDGQLFFISIKTIDSGTELVYWAEMTGAWASKKMEKTSCGGCNLQFEHPMYYRTHCAVFHEASLSLTVRKYHCKVCGKAVLGKQTIMKHALLNHDGKGAYQCQFCSKFFLRLNYLEMHRNYGCSANPHRARPLCDYCGRKFCQPQKLKVHIKRMHSDLAEVLHEFQCRDCLKILGSRAALQRHTKEVHKRPPGVSCSKCSKTFQNKSNLKIHMLTHSGIKPFKCQEDRCAAAFTTKQCLQFHYKKVHGLTEDRFPSIVRSVDYTFESYAGVNDCNEMDDATNDRPWPEDAGGEKCAQDTHDSDDMNESLDVNDSPIGPVCEETSVIEYHSSSIDRKNQHQTKGSFGEALELSRLNKGNQGSGVIINGPTSNASLLVEAALESAEKELCHDAPSSPASLSPNSPSVTGQNELSRSEQFSPRSSHATTIMSVEHLSDVPMPLDNQKLPNPASPGILPVYDSGLRQCTPPMASSPHVNYLSPRYDRHYLSPPPQSSEYLPDEHRFHNDDIAQNLTKYSKYEDARVMYHELIPRYPPPPLTTVDYFGPWDLLRPPTQSEILRPPPLPQAISLPATVDLSVNAHIPTALDRPPSPPYHQLHHIPHKSPIYHRYGSYY